MRRIQPGGHRRAGGPGGDRCGLSATSAEPNGRAGASAPDPGKVGLVAGNGSCGYKQFAVDVRPASWPMGLCIEATIGGTRVNIGIIGAGHIGGTAARLFAKDISTFLVVPVPLKYKVLIPLNI